MRAYAAPDTQALRGWQRRALVRYLAAQPRDFLTVATPGSGKTAFALRVAGELLADGSVTRSPSSCRPNISRRSGRWPLRASAWRSTRSSPIRRRRRPRSTTASSSPTPKWPVTRAVTGCARRTTARWSSSTRSTTAATRRAGARRSARPLMLRRDASLSPAPRSVATTPRSRS